MGFLDDIGGFLGGIPVVGDVLKGLGPAAGPLASLIPGVGPILSTVLGGLGGAAGGGGLEAILGGAGAGMSAAQLQKAMEEQNRDRKKARELAMTAVDRTNRASDVAHEQFGLNAPLRGAFRMGSLNFQDPTNPFSRGEMFAQFRDQLQQEPAPATAGAGGGGRTAKPKKALPRPRRRAAGGGSGLDTIMETFDRDQERF